MDMGTNEAARFRRHSAEDNPRIVDGASPKLIAMTVNYGLHVLKFTDYNCFDEDDSPQWVTACSEAWTVEREDIIWWAYADDVQALLEAFPIN